MAEGELDLYIFIDALGWEVLERNPQFLADITQDKRSLNTIFGYSSACDPSIISGKMPSDHLHWSSFYYSPATSPFKHMKYLRWLPKCITCSGRVRHWLSRAVATIYGFTGYFELYNVPFEKLSLFDYTEKKWMWGTRGSLLQGRTIFEDLLDAKVPFYVKKSVTISDEEQLRQVEKCIDEGNINFAYLLFGKLDALMHAKGNDGPEITALLSKYDAMIRNLIARAEKRYEKVNWHVFSDHGMHNVHSSYNLQKDIPLTFGKDYVCMYDSTMARFWFENDAARQTIIKKLSNHPMGSLISKRQLQKWGTYFPDHMYGEAIFLMNSGTLITPSFMGEKAIPGMHGYHPEDPDSKAAIISSRQLPESLTSIRHIYDEMTKSIKK